MDQEQIIQKYLQSTQKINQLNIHCQTQDVMLKVYYLKYLTYDPNKSRPGNAKVHSHSFFELHLIMKGENVYNLNDQMVTLREGQFLLMTPWTRHALCNNIAKFNKIALCFDLEFPEGSALESYNHFLQDSTFFTGFCDERILEPIEYIFLHTECGEFGAEKVIEWNLLIMLMALIKQCSYLSLEEQNALRHRKVQREDEFLTLCKSFIQSNLNSPKPVADLAQHLYMSERQLRRKLFFYNVKKPHQLIDEVRCERIRNLLLAQERIPDICTMVGLSDEHSLNRFFKRMEGQTPAEYRSSILKSNYAVK